MPEPAAGVMRMSADDDNQTDQQRELVDPGMLQCLKRDDRNFIVDPLW